MNDREKVLKGLECLADIQNETCTGCGYIGIGIYPICVREVSKDALALLKEDYRSWLMDMFHKYERDDLAAFLVQYGEEDLLATVLKEQEAAKPKYTPKSIYSWECGVCGEPFDRIAKFCPECGRKVKWND